MAGDDDPTHWIVPTRGAKTLPAVEVLTGRGFVTGKSGSGKSNTASVIVEELLDAGFPLLIVDTEGEYYGLKAEYELLHVGADETHCDARVTADDAEKLAAVALEENVPVVLDVSDFLDGDAAADLIASVVRELYHREKSARKPFLLLIEELQEYLPQSGGSSELAELLERVAKRGRKRGLGMLGLSQRPSSVDKDFITQCDWMVWHRLTWKNDVDVVRNILGSEIATEIEGLDTGEAYLMTDWDEAVERVTFKRKRTHDAGATPGLEQFERPDLQSVSSDLLADFTDERGGSEPSTATTAGSEAESSTESEAESGSESVSADIPGGFDGATDAQSVDPATLDRDELIALVGRLRERNETLTRTVERLRTGERTAESQAAAAAPRAGQESVAPPAGPQPPSRPATRTGLSGTIVEFTALSLYLLQVCVYRVRLLGYRLRTGGTDDRER
ncbi:ATP-binding protein [Haloarcula salina]|uniref:ATP-binding protein n=1 Tax=Haloarcula salina TaxID=1429914 RepID=UPI003C6FA992